jgi:hypothetical protein
VAEKKFSVSPVPSATVGKAFADDLIAFAENFRLSAKPGFPVVSWYFYLCLTRLSPLSPLQYDKFPKNMATDL